MANLMIGFSVLVTEHGRTERYTFWSFSRHGARRQAIRQFRSADTIDVL